MARLPINVASDPVPKEARAQKPTMRRRDMMEERRKKKAMNRLNSDKNEWIFQLVKQNARGKEWKK